MNIKDRLLSGWNAFMGRDPTPKTYAPTFVTAFRPDKITLTRGSERTIINSILNRIAVDAASIGIEHVNLDEHGRYREPRLSKLNECLTIAANVDQTARAFMEDAVMSMLDEGHIAIVPTRATDNPINTSSYDIGELRIGKVVKWYPYHVTVNLYNEDTGEIVVVSPWFTYPAGDSALFEELSQKERMAKNIVYEYFSTRTRKELLKHGEKNIKDDLLKEINSQLVLGKINGIYFSEYIFFANSR